MKTVVIIDTLWLGHVPTYHKLITERFLAAGYQVISLSPKSEEMESWAAHTLESSQRSRLFIENIFSNEFNAVAKSSSGRDIFARLFKMKHYLRAVEWWRQCASAIEKAQLLTSWTIDFAFLPGVETNIITTALTGCELDRIFRFKWAGLYVTPKYLRKSFFKFWHKRLLRKDRFFEARNCIAVAVLDEGIAARLGRIIGKEKVVIMPDITYGERGAADTSLAAKLRGASQNRPVIGLFGEMSERKGIKTLIAAAHLAKKLNRDWFFVFAGSMSTANNTPQQLAELDLAIASAPDNCFFSLARIEDETVFNDLMHECNIVFASYKKFYHSSNILTKAALFKKPVLVSKGYCMQERIERFGIGVAVPEDDPGACFTGIEALLQATDIDGKGLALDFEGYALQHSVNRLNFFLARLLARLEAPHSALAESQPATRLVTRLD